MLLTITDPLPDSTVPEGTDVAKVSLAIPIMTKWLWISAGQIWWILRHLVNVKGMTVIWFDGYINATVLKISRNPLQHPTR